MKLSETMKQIIGLAESIRSYWDSELPKRHPKYPIVSPDGDDGPPPAEEQKLKDLFSSLTEDDIYKTLLTVYLGRGDFDTSDLDGEYGFLKEMFGKSDQAVSRMVAQAPLGEYLEEGMVELSRHRIDIDDLRLSAGRVGSRRR